MSTFADTLGTTRADAPKGVSVPWLPLVPLLAIPILGTSPERLELVVLGMQAIFLLMALRNPVWVLGALALSEFTIRNYELMLPATALIVLGHALVDADLGSRARAMTITAGLFLSLAIVSTLAADAALIRDLLRSYAPDIAIMLMIPLVIRDRHSFLQAGIVALIVATASAAVALAQQVAGPRFLAVPHNTVVNVDLADWGNRALGLDLNPILLTDHLMLLLFPVVGILLMRGASSRVSGFLLLAAVLAMAGALFFTETRSWVFSAAAALVAMALLLRGRTGGELILCMLLVAGGFLFWADQSGSRYTVGPDSDGSAAARPVLWSAALNMAMDHPVLGVGYDQFKELSPSYANNIGKALLDRQNAGTILGRASPHNDFLSAWVSFGTGGLMLYVLMMWFTARNFLHALWRFRDPLMKGIALGCFGALIAFAVNSSFHNLFTSALTFWILAGASLALTKLAEREPAHEAANEAEGD
ncbi:MAG: O-antigen ligase family protein [Chloroflexi bacterium]|nr:O-antigen ligase family protein [Chloroflexota bacterium]MCI0856560.1 O-antigen ligase family protein [Chloroflexota bacterium]